MAEVIIKKGEGRSFKAGGLWIYDNEIDKINGEFENGDIVEVLDFDGYFLGKGGLNIGGKFKVDEEGNLTSKGDINTIGQLYAYNLKAIEKIGLKRSAESEDTENDYIVNWTKDVTSDAFISKITTGECIYFGYKKSLLIFYKKYYIIYIQ